MKFDKPKIKKILSGIIDSNDIININHFDKEIIIDINSTNPTLKHKKELEKKILENLNANYSKDFTYKLNITVCLLYTSPSPRDRTRSRMPSSA